MSLNNRTPSLISWESINTQLKSHLTDHPQFTTLNSPLTQLWTGEVLSSEFIGDISEFQSVELWARILWRQAEGTIASQSRVLQGALNVARVAVIQPFSKLPRQIHSCQLFPDPTAKTLARLEN